MNIQQLKTNFSRYILGTDFSKGMVLALDMVLKISVAYYFDVLPLGISLAMGAFLVAPSDVPGNLKHRLLGMLTAVFLGVSVTLLGGFLNFSIWIELPIYFVVIFGIAYLSVYGFRASLVTFTGLIACVLGFAKLGGDNMLLHSLLIGLGGLWYIFITTVYWWLRPEKHDELLLGETAELTSKFLAIRAKLTDKNQREDLLKEQFNLQISINDLHESLREGLIGNRKRSGRSNSSRRKILIFIDLVDILELSISHPVNFNKIDDLQKEFPEVIEAFKNLINEMSNRLMHISEVFIDGKKLQFNKNTKNLIAEIEALIDTYKKTEPYPESRPMLLLMRNLLDYEKKQHEKIQSIERILETINEKNTVKLGYKKIEQFITPTDYSFRILKENFSLSSTIFRHSLRLAILMMVGILIGHFFHVQNSYWILLTIVVIMRPNYGLTKERSKQRIIGTIVGGLLALGIVLLVKNPWVYIVCAVLSLILAFSMLQKNYVGAAIFITLMVVFVYALIQPNTIHVIQFRVVDTVIGAILAILGNKFIFPSWEHLEIENTIANVIEKNIAYLKEIDTYYHNKEKLSNSYKLARKEAFLAMGNLSAAFQRTSQEPKSNQRQYSYLYRYTVLNYTFLTSLASLGTFIRTHKTTEASIYFETYVSYILNNLKLAMQKLNQKVKLEVKEEMTLKDADNFLHQENEKLNTIREKELEEGQDEISMPLRNKMQEVQLISEQLKWLHQVSLNLKNINSTATYERLF
ncbi:FUSC family protein [Mesonia oceanica]|uniref:Inner membrane protein YccS n=1 Tax=Mesonia oceanica TaxID=2687242 RepID=A0AC61Y8Y7_9FLAO|nr:FUSC family protein [Mesonia oceanica]MAQ40629.1 FUSC family protein [Mesonia sp.]VVV00986.1 Inner membrane protein YccS [Mesonia oceanica]|tara:strand:- start:13442 stop:15688 length:2247 start_codon:yes stop_codon:yes gene_type:complete